MLAFIDAAESFEELSVPPNFGLHELTGDRKGSWSMAVTRNWRLTFGLNDEGALIDMDLEDYHGASDAPFTCSPRRRLAEDGNCGARACQRECFGRAFWPIAAGLESIVERE